jgi:hypothetical protein
MTSRKALRRKLTAAMPDHPGISEDQAWEAALTLCGGAVDAADGRDLLEACGLTGKPRKRKAPAGCQGPVTESYERP